MDDDEDLQSLAAAVQRASMRVGVAFTDSLVGSAWERVHQHLDAAGVLVLQNWLEDAAQARRFLRADHIDGMQTAVTARQIGVELVRHAEASSSLSDVRTIGLSISSITDGGGHLVLHDRQATYQCTFDLRSCRTDASRISSLRTLIVQSLSVAVGMQSFDALKARPSSHSWIQQQAHPHWLGLIEGETALSGQCLERPILFPGSFYPIHQGHRQMMAIASALFRLPVYLEISIVNADKPPLDFLTIAERVADAELIGPVVLTNAPRFIEKACLFPGATFLIGADTAVRLDDVRFYENSAAKRDDAIGVIADQGCRFLVFGRLVGDRFRDAVVLSLTPRLRELCQFVPASEFRVDVSSRELRQSADSGSSQVD